MTMGSIDSSAAEAEIRALVHKYADAASRRDGAGVASVFTVDGEWRSDAIGVHQGRAAIEAFFADMLQGWNAFVQALLSGVVRLDAAAADRARGRWFVQEIGQRGDGTNLSVAGVYHDEYVRGADEWRLSRRRYDPLLVQMDDAVTALPYPGDVTLFT